MYARQILLSLSNAQRSAPEDMDDKQRLQNLKERLKDVPRIYMGKHELVFDWELDEHFAEKARQELRETPDVVKEALKEIRLLLEGEPDLYVPDEDEFFIKFLRPCKWYAKSAFELMKRFYKFRLNYPRISTDLLPINERAVFCSGVMTPMPYRTEEGCRVLIIEGGKKWKPKEVSLDQMFKGTMLSLDAAISEPNTQVGGVRVVIDMDGMSLSHVTQFTPSFAAMMVEWVQRCVPCRLKGIHIVNQPFIFNMIYALFKPLLQEKMRKRLHFHGSDRPGLYSFIEQKVLPVSLGGEVEFSSKEVGETIWKFFCEFNEDFEASNTYGYVGHRKG